MDPQDHLVKLILHEAFDEDGIAVSIRMGQDPGRERMGRLNRALKELDEVLRGQATLDRRLAYAFWTLAYYVDQNLHSWAREGREWRPELLTEESIELGIHVENLFEGGLTGDEAGDET